MATLYFNGAVNNNWSTLGNWWQDSNFTVPATSLPTSLDDVVSSAVISSKSGGQPTVRNFTTNSILRIDITVSGDAIFNENSYNDVTTVTGNVTYNNTASNGGSVIGNVIFNNSSFTYGTITGNVVFNDNSSQANVGVITGDVTFNDNSGSSGRINGNATLNDNSGNIGTVTGDVIFTYLTATNGNVTDGATNGIVNGLTKDSVGNTITNWTFINTNNVGIVTGNATFNNNRYNFGTVTGNAIFTYLTATNGNVTDITGYANGIVNGLTKDSVGNTITNWTFINTNNVGIVTGNATFNNNCYNSGTVTGNATFNDISINTELGIINGNATFNDSSINYIGGIVGGNATFTYLTETNGNVNDITGYANGIVYGLTKDSVGNTITNWTFINTNNYGYVSGNATFKNNSINNGTVGGDAIFNDTSSNNGSVYGNITYDLSPRSLYFNNATEDNDWHNLNNWWTNESCTTQATTLPTSKDDVFILNSYVYQPYGSEPVTINNLTSYGSSVIDLANCNILGVGKFYDHSSVSPNNETINGLLEFYDYSTSDGHTGENLVKFYDYSVANAGVENGIFYDNSNYAASSGWSSGNTGLSFYNNSQNTSTAYIVNCTFYDSSTYNPPEESIEYIYTATFNDYSVCNGRVNSVTFNDYSSNIKDQTTNIGALWYFNGHSFNDANLTLGFGISFNDNSYNLGSVTEETGYGIDFNNNSFNNGIASSPYNGVRYNGFTGTNSYGTFLSGGKPTTLYYFYETGSETEYWDITSWFYDENHSIPSQQFPSIIDSVVALSTILNSSTYPNITNLTFGNSSSNFSQSYIETIHYYNGYVTVNGECSIGNCFFDGASSVSFNDNSSIVMDNGGTFALYGSSISFNDNSFINVSNGYVRCENGPIYFNDNSFSTIVDPYLYAYEDIVFNGFTGTNSFGTFLNGKRQFYFNGAVDGDWQTLGNWWMDDQFTIPATALPTGADDVVASAKISINTGSEPTIENFTINNTTNQQIITDPSLEINITVTGVATFNGNTFHTSTITGNAIFNDYAFNNQGTINGDCVFNSSSANDFGTVSGNATFNDSSYNNYGTVTGDATFNDGSFNNSSVGGNATFNDSSYNNYGNGIDNATITGDATFNDNSINNGIVTGNATFNNYSYNNGTVEGNATFNNNSYNNGAGVVNGNATFNDNSDNAFGTVNGSLIVGGNRDWYGSWWINNVQTTLRSGGVGIWNGSFYRNSVIYTTNLSTIYVRASGNDNNEGSENSPLLSAQTAFEMALFSSGNILLDFGVGNFDGVVLSQDWPSRISVRGVSSSQSFLGGINGNGLDDIVDFNTYEIIRSPTNGHNIHIIGDKTINLGNISSIGGANYGGQDPSAGGGGQIILFGIKCENVSCSAGFSYNDSESAGSITMTDSESGDIVANGGESQGNFYALFAGSGGEVTINNSFCGDITANGGGSTYIANGGDGGSITLNNSTCGEIISSGGFSNYQYNNYGGNGGEINLYNSTSGSIYSEGGISSGSGGVVTLSGDMTIPNTIKAGSIISTNLNKGLGLKGSNILGLN